MKLRQALAKALGVRYPSQGQGFWSFLMPSAPTAEMLRSVGDGTTSSVVMAPLQWMCRTFPEAPLVVDHRVEEVWEVQTDHPMAELIARPNPFWSGDVLWWATVLSLITSGNGYWIKATNRVGEPIELWWSPTWCMEPRWPDDGTKFISHYEYNVGVGEPKVLKVEDVIHFRWGVDPQNIRKGLSPLASVMREIFSDQEANQFSAALLKNMGVPGLIISPDGDAIVSDEDLEASRLEVKERFTGERRGEPFVAGAPTKVSQFGFSPQQLDLRSLRRLPEERVSAVIGVPAIVAGLGAGLDRSTFANMAEAREMAYETGIIPLQRMCAADLKNQLLGDFEGEDLRDWRARFSLDDVRVLQEDENHIVERKLKEFEAGVITRAEYRRETGRKADPADDIFLLPFNRVEVPRSGMGDMMPLNPLVPPNGSAPSPASGESSSRGRADVSVKGTPQQDRLMREFNSQVDGLGRAFAGELMDLFTELGEDAARAYLAAELSSETDVIATKQDDDVVRRIMRQIGVGKFNEEKLRPLYEAQYEKIADETVGTVNRVFELNVNLPDEAARNIIREGGMRAGLVDVEAGTRSALFRSLAESRELGEGPAAAARRIRDLVPAGRYSNAGARYRSQLIARTETKYAQNVSAMSAYKASGVVQGLLAYDAQGSTSDAECQSRDGVTFTFAEADTELASEHPNGTLSFAPVVGG